jgi:hypothetical protein
MATTKLQLNTTESNGFVLPRLLIGLPNAPAHGISAPKTRRLTC